MWRFSNYIDFGTPFDPPLAPPVKTGVWVYHHSHEGITRMNSVTSETDSEARSHSNNSSQRVQQTGKHHTARTIIKKYTKLHWRRKNAETRTPSKPGKDTGMHTSTPSKPVPSAEQGVRGHVDVMNMATDGVHASPQLSPFKRQVSSNWLPVPAPCDCFRADQLSCGATNPSSDRTHEIPDTAQTLPTAFHPRLPSSTAGSEHQLYRKRKRHEETGNKTTPPRSKRLRCEADDQHQSAEQ